jgi:hypothetical protein
VEIGDDFFDPFTQSLSFNEEFHGWITSTKYDFKLYPGVSLVVVSSLQAIYLKKKGDIEVVHSIPSGSKSWIHSRSSGLMANLTIRVKYQIF